MHLRLLGPVGLIDDQGVDVLKDRSQPKRVALLAYLALVAPNAFVRRDTLLALFWPDSTEKDARRSLNQAIHYLRQLPGPELVLSRGADEVGVDSSHLRVDA